VHIDVSLTTLASEGMPDAAADDACRAVTSLSLFCVAATLSSLRYIITRKQKHQRMCPLRFALSRGWQDHHTQAEATRNHMQAEASAHVPSQMRAQEMQANPAHWMTCVAAKQAAKDEDQL
jgi:hypothetical protein